MVPYLRAANVKDGELDLSDVKSMNFTPNEQKFFQLRPGDILITEGSGSLRTVGASAVWSGEIDGVVCFQNTLLRLRPRSQATDAEFLAWWARHAFAAGLFASVATGVNIHHVSAERVRSIPVSFPDVVTQRAIVGYLDMETRRIAELVSKKRQMLKMLEDRRQAVTFFGVSGRLQKREDLLPSQLPWLDQQPSHWRTAKLTLLASLGSGHTPSREHPEWWEDCTVPWITTGEVSQMRGDRIEYIHETREKISQIGLTHSAAVLHPAGTVVLSRTASAGFSAIMGTDMATSQDFVAWTCGPRLEPRFLVLCLRAMRPDLLGRLAQGSTHKTIYFPDIESIKVPVPPIHEQRNIVHEVWRRLRPIDDVVTCLERQISLLQEHRQALITAAVTGQLDIPGLAA